MPQKKIPTLIGIFLILALIAIVSTVHTQILGKITSASVTDEPHNVKVSNISDNSLTVSWTTSSPAIGSIAVSGPSLSQKVYFDDRDISRNQESDATLMEKVFKNSPLGKYPTHFVTVRDLNPDSEYRLKIMSNGKSFDKIETSVILRTGPQLEPQPAALEPAYGTVFTSDNQPAAGALVYLTLNGSQVLSGLVTETGSWLIPLNLIRQETLQSYLNTDNRMEVLITVYLGNELASATTDTLNDSPVPLIIMGKSYDFRKIQASSKSLPQLATFPVQADQVQTNDVLGSQTVTPVVKKLSITQPAMNASLVSNLPLFQGTGTGGSTVSLAYGPQNSWKSDVTVDNNGIWRHTPVNTLPAGKQSLRVTTATGETPVTVTHDFDVLKSGTQVLGEATPSGTLTPTAAVTITPTASPTLAIETPTPTATTSTQPVSGSNAPTILLITAGLILLLGGGILFAF